MIEGSGSVPLTNGSGFRRPNNIRILLVRTDLMKGSGFLCKLWQLGEIRGHVQTVQGHTRAKRVTCAESQCAGIKCAVRIAQELIIVSKDGIATLRGYPAQCTMNVLQYLTNQAAVLQQTQNARRNTKAHRNTKCAQEYKMRAENTKCSQEHKSEETRFSRTGEHFEINQKD